MVVCKEHLLVLLTCHLFLAVLPRSEAREILSVVSGVVGAGNYSYHHVNTARLGTRTGLALALRSIRGDADVYLSVGRDEEPTFLSYEYCEVSCGLDVLKLPESAETNTGGSYHEVFSVGVYGHPRWSESHFQLALLADYDGDNSNLEDELKSMSVVVSSPEDGEVSSHSSVIWTILSFLLDVGIEIIL